MIDVIIPTYRPKDYLWKCLDSLYSQSLSKSLYRIILVLNGCKEPYETNINLWINAHPTLNILFIQTDVGGVSNARNIALDKVSGDYVAFVDDDDYLSQDYLKCLLESADSQTIGISYVYAFEDGREDIQLDYRLTQCYINNYSTQKIPYHKVRKIFSGPWMKLIPMNIIGERRFDTRFSNGEDTLFLFCISDRMKYVSFTEKKATYYRRCRDSSAISFYNNRSQLIKTELKLLFSCCAIYCQHFWRYNLFFSIKTMLGFIHGMFLSPKDVR